MKRSPSVLVLTYHFPPDGAVGGLRWAGLGKYLARRGWNVHVLTASTGASDAPEPGLTVHRVPRRRTVDDAYNDFRARRAAANPGSAAEPGTPAGRAGGGGRTDLEASPPRLRSPLAVLRREAAAALAFPDHARGWILRAAREARKVIRRHEIDFVITSGPPHSVHLAGALASGSVPLVLDFRDPWLHQLQRYRKKILLPAALDRVAEPRMAAYTARAAAGILATTAGFAAEQKAAHPDVSVHHLPNGVDPERLAGPRPDSPEPYVCHVGSLYLGRDLGSVIRAMGALAERRRGTGGPSVRLRVAGRMEGRHRERFFEEVEAAELGERVDVLGLIPGPEALDLVRSASLAVVLAQTQTLQVPAKLYESVGMGVRTLVIAERDSASFREALRLGVDACEPEDLEGILAVLDEATREGPPVTWAPLEPVDHGALAERLEGILEEIGRGPDATASPHGLEGAAATTSRASSA